MNRTLGSFAVWVGLVGAAAGAGAAVSGVRASSTALRRAARMYAWVVLGAAVVAVIAMQRALITRDFTVRYVAEHGSSRTPPLFNVATMWSALEGSILLWALLLAGFTVAVAWRFRKRDDDALVGWALVVMFAVCVFFFGLMVGPANPFLGFRPPLGYDGPGPNPLLQNHILVAFHPPMLYLGYVGFTVPFAFAVAALVTGRLGEGWLLETRRWTILSWGFLTAGIVLGAWWSYEVLGWGGYWGWDPVENASFLPWLTGTAYLHSVLVQERRGMLRVWNLTLLCATFSLTILGTFLTRSGVVQSVHAFSNSSIGPLLLGFFGLVVVVSVGLIGWRGDLLRAPGRIDSVLSREAAFLANNVVFAAFAFVVLLGTVFPLVVEAVQNRQISVGEPYFTRMTAPIGFALLTLMAIAPVLPWRAGSVELLSRRLFWPAVTATAVLVMSVLFGARGWSPLLAFWLGGFAAGSAGRQLVLATRRHGWRGLVGRANGGMIVHLGTIMVAVALAASSSAARRAEFTLKRGEERVVAGHRIRFVGSDLRELDARTEFVARVSVDGAVYEPRINRYRATAQSIGTPSVRQSPVSDVYLSLDDREQQNSGSIRLRVVVQPLIVWLWTGGLVMVAGSVLSAFPGRRRRPVDPVSITFADELAGREPGGREPGVRHAERPEAGVAREHHVEVDP